MGPAKIRSTHGESKKPLLMTVPDHIMSSNFASPILCKVLNEPALDPDVFKGGVHDERFQIFKPQGPAKTPDTAA